MSVQWESAKEAAFRLGTHPFNIRYWGRQGFIRTKRGSGFARMLYLVPKRPRIQRGHKLSLSRKQRRDVMRYRGMAASYVIGVIFGVSGSTIRDIWNNRRQPKSLKKVAPATTVNC